MRGDDTGMTGCNKQIKHSRFFHNASSRSSEPGEVAAGRPLAQTSTCTDTGDFGQGLSWTTSRRLPTVGLSLFIQHRAWHCPSSPLPAAQAAHIHSQLLNAGGAAP